MNDLHVLNLESLEWTRATLAEPLPLPRQGHIAARHGRELLVAGGCDVAESGPTCFDDVWTLDMFSMRWRKRAAGGEAWQSREGHSAVFVRGKMVSFGGCGLATGCFGDVFLLDTHEPCPASCGGRGSCVSEPKVGLYCQCMVPGFSGHDCLQPVSCLPEDCGSNGVCSLGGACKCKNGWGGQDCSKQLPCPGFPAKCNGRGLCLANGICSCLPGFLGKDCGLSPAFLQDESRSKARHLSNFVVFGSVGNSVDVPLVHFKKDRRSSVAGIPVAHAVPMTLGTFIITAVMTFATLKWNATKQRSEDLTLVPP